MAQHDRIDAEALIPLAALTDALPGGFNGISDITARRATLSGLLAQMSASVPPNPHVSTENVTIDGPGGPLPLRIYRPVMRTSSRPGLLFFHGGGMILGDLDSDHFTAMMLCERTGAVTVSVDYRLAPEHPYPAGTDDCYAALEWMAANAAALDFDPDLLIVYGGSAGGLLAISTALRARDEQGPGIAYVMAPYPMIDDRNVTESSKAITDVGVWDRAGNIEAWAWFLGGRPADAYAAPARATDLEGLPPMFIDVGDQDLFMDEDVAFVERLRDADVPVEFHFYPGAYHGTEVLAPESALAKRIWAARLDALARVIA